MDIVKASLFRNTLPMKKTLEAKDAENTTDRIYEQQSCFKNGVTQCTQTASMCKWMSERDLG